nr:hypothetical protein [Escherichia coli]
MRCSFPVLCCDRLSIRESIENIALIGIDLGKTLPFAGIVAEGCYRKNLPGQS